MSNTKSAKKKITPQQILFIDKYFELNFNGTEAYLQTYPRVKNRDTARAAAARMLTNANVKAEVESRQKEARDTSKELVAQIRESLCQLAFANIGNYLSWGPGFVTLKESSGMTPEMLAAVAEVSEVVTQHGGRVRFKLESKLKALELLMKHFGMIVEKIDYTGKDSKPLGEGWVNMGQIIDDIRKAQRPGTLWKDQGPKLETGDLD